MSVGTVPTSKLLEFLGEGNEVEDVCWVIGNVTGELWATGLGGVTVKFAILGNSFCIGAGVTFCGKIEIFVLKLGSGYSKIFQLRILASKLDFRDLKLKIDKEYLIYRS